MRVWVMFFFLFGSGGGILKLKLCWWFPSEAKVK